MTGRRPPVLRHTASLIGAVLALLLFGAASVAAHSELRRSEPPLGGVAAEGRTSITLWFTDPISAEASTFDLHTLEGVPVPTTAAVSVADGGAFVQITAPPMTRGTYVLAWSVLSAEDGHPTRGTTTFGVGVRPAIVSASGSGLPEAQGVLLRWLDLTAIMLAIGALVVSSSALRPAGPSAVRRALRIGSLAACAAVITGAVTPLVITPRGGAVFEDWLGDVAAALSGTQWGRIWLGREVALLVVAVALWSAAKGERARYRIPAAGVALAAAVLLESLAGHAAALPRDVGLAALASATHLVAAGVWVGGLAVMAACLLPAMRRDPASRRSILGTTWRAFSPVAAVATVVLFATGLYEAGRHLPDLGSAASTVYGTAAAAKGLLMLGALALAGVNTLIVNPRVAGTVSRVLRRPAGWLPVPMARFAVVVGAELSLLVIAIGAAAVLTTVPTAREVGTAAVHRAPAVAAVDDLFVTLEGVPADADQTRLIVRARSIIKPAPGPIDSVSLALTGPNGISSEASLDKIEPGRYESEVGQLIPGSWRIAVAVRRAGVPDAVATIPWLVEPPPSDGARALEVATGAMAAATLGALTVVLAFTMARAGRGRSLVAPATWPHGSAAIARAGRRRYSPTTRRRLARRQR